LTYKTLCHYITFLLFIYYKISINDKIIILNFGGIKIKIVGIKTKITHYIKNSIFNGIKHREKKFENLHENLTHPSFNLYYG